MSFYPQLSAMDHQLAEQAFHRYPLDDALSILAGNPRAVDALLTSFYVAIETIDNLPSAVFSRLTAEERRSLLRVLRHHGSKQALVGLMVDAIQRCDQAALSMSFGDNEIQDLKSNAAWLVLEAARSHCWYPLETFVPLVEATVLHSIMIDFLEMNECKGVDILLRNGQWANKRLVEITESAVYYCLVYQY